MNDYRRRLSKSFAAAVGIHVLAAALLGFIGYSFQQRPPQILEVTLAGGGGGGPEAGVQEAAAEEQSSPALQEDEEEIVEQRPQVVQQPKPVPKPQVPVSRSVEKQAPATSNAVSGKGTGHGSGVGKGEGTGSGSGSGSGVGDDNGAGSGRGVPATPPRLLSKTEPRYPAAARNREIEGTVRVKMLVSDKGLVEQAFVVQTSGSEALDNAAIEAVYKWRFSPAKDKLGLAAPCYITLPVKFTLR